MHLLWQLRPRWKTRATRLGTGRDLVAAGERRSRSKGGGGGIFRFSEGEITYSSPSAQTWLDGQWALRCFTPLHSASSVQGVESAHRSERVIGDGLERMTKDGSASLARLVGLESKAAHRNDRCGRGLRAWKSVVLHFGPKRKRHSNCF